MNKVGLKRDTKDQFYTNKDVSLKCFQYITENIDITNTLFLEPSAGNGSFTDILLEKQLDFISYDIEPKKDYIIKQDFLDKDLHINSNKKIVTLGNPPFGRQSSLAKKFIKKCSKFSETIAFILPKSFKKESMQKCFPLNFHLIFQQDIEERSFNIDNKIYNVECIFQIWTKKETKRQISEIETSKYLTFVKKDQQPDISFRRVGVYAGKISQIIDDKSEQSHYFIKIKNKNIEDFIKEYNEKIVFNHNNTIGPKSISKKELVSNTNRI